MDDLELSEWVRTQVALLDPPENWEPSPAIARARLEGRRIARVRARRYAWAAVAAVSLVCALFPMLPRMAAQSEPMFRWSRIESWWNWFTLIQGNAPTAFMPRVLPPGVKAIERQVWDQVGAAQEVADATEAGGRAGFVPRMPRALGGVSRISVIAPMSIHETVITDLETPKPWPVEFKTSAAVIATWQHTGEWSEVTLAQTAPPVVTGPAGFDAAEFTAAILRTYGTTLAGQRNPARVDHLAGEHALARFAGMPAATAALMIGNRTGAFVAVSQVRMHAAPATMIVGPLLGNNFGFQRVTALWIASGRLYLLSGELNEPISAGLNPDVANAMAHVIGLANSIE